MNSIELEKLVREIVEEVLRRIQNDPNLSATVRMAQGPLQKSKYAATCTQQAAMLRSRKKLYNEQNVLELAKQGVTEIRIETKTIVTPAARDAARDKGVRIIRESI